MMITSRTEHLLETCPNYVGEKDAQKTKNRKAVQIDQGKREEDRARLS